MELGEGCTSAPFSRGENTSSFHGFSYFILALLLMGTLEVKLTCTTVLFTFHHTASVQAPPYFKKFPLGDVKVQVSVVSNLERKEFLYQC